MLVQHKFCSIQPEKHLEIISCYQPFSVVVNVNTIIIKFSKENHKKCLEITEDSLLFRCRNSQNAN